MKVKISEFKARLSAYLDAVRRGQTVTVLDRKTPVARVVPIDEGSEATRISEPERALSEMSRIEGVKPKRPVDVLRILAETRADR